MDSGQIYGHYNITNVGSIILYFINLSHLVIDFSIIHLQYLHLVNKFKYNKVNHKAGRKIVRFKVCKSVISKDCKLPVEVCNP